MRRKNDTENRAVQGQSLLLLYYCPTTKKHGCTDGVTLKESELMACVLDSVKAHIANIASVEAVLAGSDSQRAILTMAGQYRVRIVDNERQLDKIVSFKATLYENMVSGIISKEDYKALKAKYMSEETLLRDAIATLQGQLEDVLAGKSDRLRFMEHFRTFEGLSEIDRRTVVNLIQTIHVVSKTELQITFNYQAEYENAVSLIVTREVA